MMNVDEILNAIDEVLDNSWSLPMSGGRCVVDAEKVRDMIDDIRANLPGELRQSQAIVADRSEILATAKKESESLIRKAEERARALLAQEEVVRQAQAKAADILSQAQVKSREIRQASQDFTDNVLRTTEESLIKSLQDVRATRQALRTTKTGK
jgi:hypothetical protein